MSYLTGKAVVVTGAGRGIGRAYAQLAAAEGAAVVVNDIDAEPASAVADEISSAGGTALAVVADVSNWSEAAMLIDACVEEFDAIDGLINNAGRYTLGDLDDIDEAHVSDMLATNVVGTIACGTHALRRMVSQRRGSLVNVTSGAHCGIPHMAVYSATKGAVASLTYSWSLEVSGSGVRVNAISPMGRTRMVSYSQGWYRERGAGDIDYENTPAPEMNAPPAIYLLSDASAALNGQIVRIEGKQLSIVAHPVVRDPVLIGDWTVANVAEAFAEQLSGQLVPVGVGPLLRAEYLDGASAFWDGEGATAAVRP